MATPKESRALQNFLLGFIFFMVILLGTNLPASQTIIAYIFFAGVTIFAYRIGDFLAKALGIRGSRKDIFIAAGWALIFSGVFWLITKLVPGASIGLPLLPASIGDTARFLLIIIAAPIAEEALFRGAILGWLRRRYSLQIALLMQAFLFAIAHVGAYIIGFYDYPSFTEGLTAFSANTSSFFAAGIFGYLIGLIASRDGIKNLIFAMITHMLANLIIYTGFSVVIG